MATKGIDFETAAPIHPAGFVSQAFKNVIRAAVPTCPKCSQRLAYRKNDLVCVVHGPVKVMDQRKPISPDVPLFLRNLPPAKSCADCGASVMMVDGNVVCHCCETKKLIERNKAEIAAKLAKEPTGGKDSKPVPLEGKDSLQGIENKKKENKDASKNDKG